MQIYRESMMVYKYHNHVIVIAGNRRTRGVIRAIANRIEEIRNVRLSEVDLITIKSNLGKATAIEFIGNSQFKITGNHRAQCEGHRAYLHYVKPVPGFMLKALAA